MELATVRSVLLKFSNMLEACNLNLRGGKTDAAPRHPSPRITIRRPSDPLSCGVPGIVCAEKPETRVPSFDRMCGNREIEFPDSGVIIPCSVAYQ